MPPMPALNSYNLIFYSFGEGCQESKVQIVVMEGVDLVKFPLYGENSTKLLRGANVR
jgi:hypothetical protein